jgi:high mobility group AT-hook protein 2
MSTSPQDQQEEGVALDELDDANHVVDTDAGTSVSVQTSYFSLLSFLDVGRINPFFYLDPSPTTPVKRGRGRPKGSKNKKATSSSAAEGSSAPAVQRKRGRPPKVSIML